MGAAAFCRDSPARRAAATACWAAIGPGAAGQPLGAVELLVRPAELAAAALVQRRLPGLGDLASPPQGRAADLVPGQVLDPLQRPGRLAGVEVGADLVGDPVGQAEPGRGQRVGRGPHPLGQVQVVDRPGQVVGRAAAGRPGDQVQGQPAAELHRVVVVGDVGPAGQGDTPRRSGPPARPPPPVARRFANVPAWLTCRPD